MIPAPSKPDLSCIGERAFTEVLGVLFSLPAAIRDPSSHSPLSDAPDQITSAVPLVGQRLAGSVYVQLPLEFVAQAVRRLTGLEGTAGEPNAMLDDAAGELANMVAGRVAAQLEVDGYPCALGTPAVFRRSVWPLGRQPGVDHGRADMICEGHRVSLELQCRYADP